MIYSFGINTEFGSFTLSVCVCDCISFCVCDWMDTMHFHGPIHITQRKTSKETIADANADTQCEWVRIHSLDCCIEILFTLIVSLLFRAAVNFHQCGRRICKDNEWEINRIWSMMVITVCYRDFFAFSTLCMLNWEVCELEDCYVLMTVRGDFSNLINIAPRNLTGHSEHGSEPFC